MPAFLIFLLLGAGQFSQSTSGELRVVVRDASELAVQCQVTLVSEANDVSQQVETDSDGLAVAKRLPFGRYRLAINQPGFAPYDGRVEIDSALPRQVSVTLTLAPIRTQVTVQA